MGAVQKFAALPAKLKGVGWLGMGGGGLGPAPRALPVWGGWSPVCVCVKLTGKDQFNWFTGCNAIRSGKGSCIRGGGAVARHEAGGLHAHLRLVCHLLRSRRMCE